MMVILLAWFVMSIRSLSNDCLVKESGYDMLCITWLCFSWNCAGSMLTMSRLRVAYDRGYPAVSQSVCVREDHDCMKLGIWVIDVQYCTDSHLCWRNAYWRLPPPYCWHRIIRASRAVRLVPVDGSWMDGIIPRIFLESFAVITLNAMASLRYQFCQSWTCACVYPGGRIGGNEGALRAVHWTLGGGGSHM